MYWGGLSAAANAAAAYQTSQTGYAVSHTPAAGTYTTQRAPNTYDANYQTATSHAPAASYPASSTTYDYGYTARTAAHQNPTAAAAAAVYDTSKSYYGQQATAAAATAATPYTAADTHYQTSGQYMQPSVQSSTGPAANVNKSSGTWQTMKKGPMGGGGGGFNRNHKPKAPPRQQQLHYCDVCKISCAGPQTYREHLEGQKHKKKEAAAKAGPVPSRVGASLRCELCDVTCTGADAYAAHIRGAKHQKVVKLHQKLGKPIPSSDPVVVGLKGTTSATTGSSTTTTGTKAGSSTAAGAAGGAKKDGAAASTAEQMKEDLLELKEKEVEPVGQEYIEEIKGTEGDTNGKVISFNCKLCECRFNDPNAKEMHMKGRRHRLQYKKKVNPDLQVEVKPSLRQRKLYEEKIRRQQHMGRRPDTSDDRHVISKHAEIYPQEDELASIQKIVSNTEKALKLVSDYLADLDAPKDSKVKEEKKEPEPTKDKTDASDSNENISDFSSEKEKKDDSPSRMLKGVMRVGILAKGLLLKGDTRVELVVLCGEKPTRTLLDRVADALPQHLSSVAPGEKYDVQRVVEEAALHVLHGIYTVSVTLTAPIMREQIVSEGSESQVAAPPRDAPDVLDKQKCLDALASLRHAKWFQARATGLQSCVMVIRIMRDLCKRVPTWRVLNSWALELICEKVIASAGQPLSPGDCVRRVFEAVSSGLLLPGSPGLMDPCEKDPIDAAAHLTAQEREDLTASSQHALRLIAFRQIHSVLGMDAIPPPKFTRNGRFNRKRRRDQSTGEGGDSDNEQDGSEGKKDKKEDGDALMETEKTK